MGTVMHVTNMGTPGTYRPADESLGARTVLQPALSSTNNVSGKLSSIGQVGAPKKRAETTGQKIISFLKARLPDQVAYIRKSSLVPTRFNVSAIIRSTPGDLVILEATTNINKLRADFRLLQSHFEFFDSESNRLFAFGKMCEIDDTVQSSLKEAQKLKRSLSAVHISAIGLDTLIEEYESLGKNLDSERLTNFHNNRNISQARIQRIWKDIDPTINKIEKLADIPSPRVAKNMGFSSVEDAKLRLSEKLSSTLKQLEQQLDTFDKNPGIHHKSIRPQLKKMIEFIKKADNDLIFNERQKNRQEHLAQKEAASSLKKYMPCKTASAGQKSMLGEKVSFHQFTEIKRQGTLEKTDLGPMPDTVSLSPPVVR